MDMTQLKTQRKSLRTSFTLSAKVIEEELMKEVPDVDQLSILKMQIGDKFSRLENYQRSISYIILKEETDELAYEEDFMKAEIYRDSFSELCAKIERLSVKKTEKKEHRPIVKNDSVATKIRPVFESSARVTGQSSLNDLLYKGPNLIEKIPDILDRFRSYPIGLSADIEKAFLQLDLP
ncbi:uncharacterized protein TNIN_419031 [Trichonephila inaurata madagascariensis]|uniref:Uncharacterized protein n=1 Tax=Trichonephila inaurata madagascariensis TaxID=2747483 RepID=A0A8X6IKG8_9ARAC|nr:uncharacterized protein TNIN_419031 [Trichonephila inaurata madagascariensis]